MTKKRIETPIDRLTAAHDNWKHEAFATKDLLTAANAEIDRLTAELAAAKEQVNCGCGICLAHNNMKCPKLSENKNWYTKYTVYGEKRKREKPIFTGQEAAKPQGNTTGNLLIPRKEAQPGCTFDE